MRPDEHKKKKNEQYKKKHGIKSGKNKVEDTIGDQKKRSYVPAKPAFDKETSDKKPVNDSQGEQPRSTFQRRKVESNWDRYTEELPSQCAADQQRGADFKDILANSSSAISQFRFKEEQGWDGEETSVSAFLSINCSDVMRAISCVPLHERLQIEPLHFQDSHLNKFKDIAVFHKAALDQKQQELEISQSNAFNTDFKGAAVTTEQSNSSLSEDTHLPVVTGAEFKSDECQDVESNVQRRTAMSGDSALISDELDEILNTGFGNTSTRVGALSKTNPLNSKFKSEKAKTAKEPKEYLDSESMSYIENNGTAKPDTSPENDTLEDDLDALLNIKDDGNSESGNIDGRVAAIKQSKGQVETENLEDWLDSVLED